MRHHQGFKIALTEASHRRTSVANVTTVCTNILANLAGQGWSTFFQLLLLPLYIHFLGIEAYGTVIGVFRLFLPASLGKAGTLVALVLALLAAFGSALWATPAMRSLLGDTLRRRRGNRPG